VETFFKLWEEGKSFCGKKSYYECDSCNGCEDKCFDVIVKILIGVFTFILGAVSYFLFGVLK